MGVTKMNALRLRRTATFRCYNHSLPLAQMHAPVSLACTNLKKKKKRQLPLTLLCLACQESGHLGQVVLTSPYRTEIPVYTGLVISREEAETSEVIFTFAGLLAVQGE